MRVLIINTVCGIGSTGRICTDIAQQYEASGADVKIAYGRGTVPDKYKKYAIKIGNKADIFWHVFITRFFDLHGFGSKHATKKFLKWVDEYNPDLVWLHNIHGYYINIELLCTWLRKRPADKQIRWTLHDCWAFTGHCAYFTAVKCAQWKQHCAYCPQKDTYPKSFRDNCYQNFERKRNVFTGLKNLTLVTPSQWLADLVKQSYLKEYPVEVHYNTVDTSIFRPTPSDFRKRYGLENKIIVLGVANPWTERKGLNDFLKLSKMLDNRYVIVLVGLTEKQIKHLQKTNPRICALKRTNNGSQLAEIYSESDIYVSASKEETFGMTQLEAAKCGTPSIVYEETACEEVAEKLGNKVVPQSVEALYEAITGNNATSKDSRGGENR